MSLSKQVLNINFAQGLDTKSDPFQVPPGRFLALENSVFTKGGLLQKRNGFGSLTALPDSTNVYTTTYNGNLLAVGDTLSAYISGASTWLSKGDITPVRLSTQALVSSNTNQSQVDTALAPNGLICTVYTDNMPSGSSTTPSYKYVVSDSTTGQNVSAPAAIPVTSGVVTGSPRVFLLGNYFIIVFCNVISAVNHLQYVSISITRPTVVSSNVDITNSYTRSVSPSFDGVVANNSLYLAWSGAGGSTIKATYIDSHLTQHNIVTISASHVNNIVSICADETPSTAVIYITAYDSISTTGYTVALNPQLLTVHAFTQVISSTPVLNVTSSAQDGVCTILYEVINNPGYDASVPANYVKKVTITQSGAVGTPATVLRGVGLASKSFICANAIYCLFIYASDFQPTYFLADPDGNVISKLAYSNGASSYYSVGLPSVAVTDSLAQVAYFYKNQIQAVNKAQGVANASGIYSQTGINLANLTIGTSSISSAEIGKDLHLSGGFMWMYDGFKPVEHNFHLWPDYVEATGSSASGGMLAQQYFYVATYEWSDNQGNIFRSAPSIPVEVDLSGSSPSGVTFTSVFSAGDTSIVVSSSAGLYVGQVLTDTTTGAHIQTGTTITSISGTTIGLSLPTAGNSAGSPGDTLKTVTTCSATVNVPTLRLTYKISNPVKLVLYRWSTAQQVYYQTTSLTAPILNDTSVDYIAITDTNPDSQILGNNILYTTGGVVEDIAAPATNAVTLWQSRLFLVDAEDENLVWFSKQVIENTPVEMSDLLTLFVPPTIGAQGSTGGIKAISSLDDKLVLFKRDAIYYISGSGPDNTGANSQFSEATFITATVGSSNQQSIVFQPNGLMFQSDKGIWLLGRDLSTSYIGAPVEAYTQSATVLSAVNVPGTNQVRFTMSSGITLMYDYYYGQWGTFVNVPAVSSTLYQSLHTYIDSYGQVFQETPGQYLDGSRPVLMTFQTSWLHMAGLEGFQRAYYFYLLATYQSPHKLQLQIAYDYNSSPLQTTIISPDNYSVPYGDDSIYGSTPTWGGESQVEQWRVFLRQQKCQAFQITLSELFDPSYGTVAGSGFTMSGLDVVVGVKKGYTTLRPSRSVG